MLRGRRALRLHAAAGNRSGSIRRCGGRIVRRFGGGIRRGRVGIGDAGIGSGLGQAQRAPIQAARRTVLGERGAGQREHGSRGYDRKLHCSHPLMIPLIYPALTTIVPAFLFNCVSRFCILLGLPATEGRRTIRCPAAHSPCRLHLPTCRDGSVIGTEPRDLERPFERRQTDAPDCAEAFSPAPTFRNFSSAGDAGDACNARDTGDASSPLRRCQPERSHASRWCSDRGRHY
jgi:hypothetical protein